MADDRETITKEDKPRSGKMDRRQIFVSHAHADRKLALEIKKLVEEAFSGTVTAYVSSDPSPTGGLKPGEAWYSAIHAKLLESESVWVLATPNSILHPWIYWEAGFGSAICPRSPVVLRVNVSNNDLPSPLNNFQTYDGLEAGDKGVGELLGKVGDQFGMTVPRVLIRSVANTWVSAAKGHKPDRDGEEPSSEMRPEYLDPLEAVVARLETAINSLTVRTLPARRIPDISDVQAEQDRYVFGRVVSGLDSVAELASVVDSAPKETAFEYEHIDTDGDAIIGGTRGDEYSFMWLEAAALKGLKVPRGASERVRSLIKEIVEQTKE